MYIYMHNALNFRAGVYGDGEPIVGSIGIRPNILGNTQGISYNIVLPNNSIKLLGTLFPGTITFQVECAESVEILEGKCNYKFNEGLWSSAGPSDWINTPSNTLITLEILDTLSYICHLK